MIAAALPLALPLAGAGLSAMALAIQSLYGMAVGINDYLDKHIEEMKGSDNPTISRTGRVLGMAKFGFGIGYITPVIVISVGQLLLGNTLSAVATVATAATLTNPIAMTCAAIGAIYYGWGALSDTERDEILGKISKGLEVGLELINSIVRFVVEKTKGLLDSKNFEEIKKYIGSAAAVFGNSLGDITHKLTDRASDTYDMIKIRSREVLDKTGDLAAEVATIAGEAIDKTAEISGQAYESVKEAGGKAAASTLETLENLKVGKGVKTSPQAVEVISVPAQSAIDNNNENRINV